MADYDPLIVQGKNRSEVQLWSERERLRQRLDENRARLRDAMEAMEEAAREFTPSARIRHDPYTWVGGAFAVGLVLGWLTARAR